jgi:hypothetical protein
MDGETAESCTDVASQNAAVAIVFKQVINQRGDSALAVGTGNRYYLAVLSFYLISEFDLADHGDVSLSSFEDSWGIKRDTRAYNPPVAMVQAVCVAAKLAFELLLQLTGILHLITAAQFT